MNFIVDLKVFPYEIMFSFGQDIDEFKLSLSEKSSLEEFEIHEIAEVLFDGGSGRTIMTNKNQTIVRLSFVPESVSEYGVLHHEIFHATHIILDFIGMKLSSKSSEVYAYVIEYITKEVYDKINN